jgi:hypothetical protein
MILLIPGLLYILPWFIHLATITDSFVVITPNRYYNFSLNELYQIKVTDNIRPVNCSGTTTGNVTEAMIGDMVEIHYRGEISCRLSILLS